MTMVMIMVAIVADEYGLVVERFLAGQNRHALLGIFRALYFSAQILL